ncbi:hypothetical protein ACJA88_014448 [Fusarium oxysporum]
MSQRARTTGVNKNNGKKKTAPVDNDRLKVLTNEAIQQAEEMADGTTTGTPTESVELKAIELREEEQPLPPDSQHIDVEMAQNTSEEEFKRLLPRLQPHLERLNLQNGAEKAVPTVEKKPRHIVKMIRATDEYQVPEFEIGQQLKEQTITISELQLLQIAPAIRQQLSRRMQCRRKAKRPRPEKHWCTCWHPSENYWKRNSTLSLRRKLAEEIGMLQSGTLRNVWVSGELQGYSRSGGGSAEHLGLRGRIFVRTLHRCHLAERRLGRQLGQPKLLQQIWTGVLSCWLAESLCLANNEVAQVQGKSW